MLTAVAAAAVLAVSTAKVAAEEAVEAHASLVYSVSATLGRQKPLPLVLVVLPSSLVVTDYLVVIQYLQLPW